MSYERLLFALEPFEMLTIERDDSNDSISHLFRFKCENDANRIGDEIYFVHTQFGDLLSQLLKS